ncbi:hypothetical protein SUBVAR_05018 [Subdoligranulum variabile DSM 15176]|uniref:Uncharacterized protein n=1 Tax=Subdoligranulum variabile DSM 15176 TaxID=411471 RepID=D1PKY3_9FIRM|nr:hypothetical protein SUBVAR_05018 [Subdoligranulum variabile DSM 15176]
MVFSPAYLCILLFLQPVIPKRAAEPFVRQLHWQRNSVYNRVRLLTLQRKRRL